jgi:hypothetical protein
MGSGRHWPSRAINRLGGSIFWERFYYRHPCSTGALFFKRHAQLSQIVHLADVAFMITPAPE